MKTQHLISVSSFICGSIYLFGFLAVMLLFPKMASDENQLIELIQQHPFSIRFWYASLYLLFPLCLLLLSLSISQSQKNNPALRSKYMNGIALLWCGLMSTSGLLAIAAIGLITTGKQLNPALFMLTLQDALGGAIELQGGLWCILATFLLHHHFRLHWTILVLGYTCGGAGIATIAPDSELFQVAFGLSQLCWFFVIGAVIVRAEQQPDTSMP